MDLIAGRMKVMPGTSGMEAMSLLRAIQAADEAYERDLK